MLNEEQIEAFVTRYGKVGIVDWSGHQLVFRRPTRQDIREYRRKSDSIAEKEDALDQLAQVTMVAFDGEQEPAAARAAFLAFLNEYPAFTSGTRCSMTLNALSGLVEEEASQDMGKGVSIRRAGQKRSPKDSPNGSVTSSPAAS
jgi:hypothetical protein